MYNPTPNETTPNLYESRDGLVTIRILDNPKRFPAHDYKVMVLRFLPQDHTRIRHLGGGIYEYMPTKEEFAALVKAFGATNPEIKIHIEGDLTNKLEERKRGWEKRNQQRVRPKPYYRPYRRYHRFRRY